MKVVVKQSLEGPGLSLMRGDEHEFDDETAKRLIDKGIASPAADETEKATAAEKAAAEKAAAEKAAAEKAQQSGADQSGDGKSTGKAKPSKKKG